MAGLPRIILANGPEAPRHAILPPSLPDHMALAENGYKGSLSRSATRMITWGHPRAGRAWPIPLPGGCSLTIQL